MSEGGEFGPGGYDPPGVLVGERVHVEEIHLKGLECFEREERFQNLRAGH